MAFDPGGAQSRCSRHFIVDNLGGREGGREGDLKTQHEG